MTHTIQPEKENFGMHSGAKFVSVRTPTGDFVTQIANFISMKKSHAQLMQGLLVSIGVLDPDIIGTFDDKGLKPFDQYCMGGGGMQGDTLEWGSNSIRDELERDQPVDSEIATLLLEDIRAWVQKVCS